MKINKGRNIEVFANDKLLGTAESVKVNESPQLLPDYSVFEAKVLADFFKGLEPGKVHLIASKTGKGHSRYSPLNLKYSVDSKSDIVYDKDIVKQRRKT